jgi:ribosomal protein L39E
MREERTRRSLSAARRNWRESDLPFFGKLRVAARNNWIKVRTRSNCCGHPGEPGC